MMKFINEGCTFCEMTSAIVTSCPPFTCSRDKDMEEFFHAEFDSYKTQLLGKSYCFVEDESPHRLVSAFTVANSSIRVDNLPNKKRNKLNRKIPQSKRKSQYPAVLVGQLAVFDDFSGHNIGDDVMDFIKSWFIDPLNKTGCRYIIVDAVNKPKVIEYYQNNGFQFLFSSAEEEMFYLRRSASNKGLWNRIKTFFIKEESINEFRKTRLMYFDLILLDPEK